MSISNRKEKFSDRCRVCQGPAQYSYFGVISCSSCKVFFRRTANNPSNNFTCLLNNQCEINVSTRRMCSACRLAKCFQCGMSTALFRSAIRSKYDRIQSEQPKKLPTLNLVDKDSSLLTTNQWNHLSNLVNSFQESSLMAISQRFMDTKDTIQTIFDLQFQTLFYELMSCGYQTTGKYLQLNHDFLQLSINDRSIILQSAANNVSCMTSSIILQRYPLYSHNAIYDTVVSMCGEELIDIFKRAIKFIDTDPVIIKLALALFAFSEITYSYHSHAPKDLTNPLHILQIQNLYAEITWKYLLYRYGYIQAIQRFLNLICWVNATIPQVTCMQGVSLHLNDVKTIAGDTELKLLLDELESTVELD